MPRIFGSASTGGGGTPGGSTTQVQFNNAGAFGGITGATTDGTTLTLVAPVLGTPASATLTNATGLPPSTGLSTFVAPLKGGLGAALVPVIGDLLYADSTTSFARIAAPAVGQVLKSNGVGVAPSWSATPALTSLALGGATIGSNALAVTGPSVFNYAVSGMGLYSVGNGQGFVSAVNNGEYQVSVNPYGLRMASGASLEWGSNAADGRGGNSVILTRAADATLRHGAADAASPVAQTIKFQDVATGTSNTAGVNATIQAPAGTGTGAGGSLIFQVAPAGSSGTAKNAWATALTIDSNKLATFAAGANFAAQVNNTGEFISTITGGGFRASASGWLYWNGKSVLSSPSDGVITVTNQAITDFTRLQFGGTTSSFPALKRSTTLLQARLADDSAFTAIQGKLTTDTAYTAGDPTTTGYLVVYDSTGTAYRVPALLN